MDQRRGVAARKGDRKFRSERHFGESDTLHVNTKQLPQLSSNTVTITRTPAQLGARLNYDNFVRTHYPRQFAESELAFADGRRESRSWRIDTDKRFAASGRKFGQHASRLYQERQFRRAEKRTFIGSYKMEPQPRAVMPPRMDDTTGHGTRTLSPPLCSDGECVDQHAEVLQKEEMVPSTGGIDMLSSNAGDNLQPTLHQAGERLLPSDRRQTSENTVRQGLNFPRLSSLFQKSRFRGPVFKPSEDQAQAEMAWKDKAQRPSSDAVRRSTEEMRPQRTSLEVLRRSRSAMGLVQVTDASDSAFVV